MKILVRYVLFLLLFSFSMYAVPPVLNYAGQVAVNGEAFNGNGLFKFALVNADGNATYWSNDGTSVDGSEPQDSVVVPVNGGLYSILLGNTAMAGMDGIDPQVFAQHGDAKLRVWFSDGVNGFQQLIPDRPFASVPYAFSAGTAQTAGSATIADGSINKSMLGSDVIADLNATIGMNRLSSEVTDKLDQNASGGTGVVAGSLIAVPYDQPAPAGYSLYQEGEPKHELIWEEKAAVSLGRYVGDGLVNLEDKIYVVGGWVDENTEGRTLVERYDQINNSWTTMSSLTIERTGLAAAVLNGKLYAIGGIGLSSVEIFDPSTESWSAGVALPSEVRYGTAITVDGMIYLIGGRNSSNQDISQVLCFDSSTNQWTAKANMPTARHGVKLVWFQNRIWAICGHPATQVVESYDIVTNSWQTESSLKISRFWSAAWVADERIYVGGGQYLNSIESYNSITKEWAITGNFPEDKYIADSIILNDKVYVIGGATAHGVYSNKVYAADLNASVAGVFDLYRKDGNASAGVPTVQAEVADGSVTGRKMADGAITPSKIATNSITTSQLNEQILKYLKPEITTQPQAQTVYADTNVSFSVTAEGKYLTYQWKKDGVNLTGETNATLNITDANATQHDGNYSVVVSNDFGSVESDINEFVVENDINKVSGLVGWWKFDEMNGSVAYDSSGNGHDGNLTNSPTWVNGKMGGALSFDGVNDYVQVIGYKGIMDSNQRTICAWIKSDKNSTAIVSWGSGQGHKYWSLGISGEGLIRKNLWNGNIKGKQNIITNEWFHVTSVFPGQEFTFGQTILFVNGVKESVSSLTGGDLIVQTTSYRDLKIGSEAWGSNWNIYNGLIDDVRIYDRALSPSEVQALYNLGQ